MKTKFLALLVLTFISLSSYALIWTSTQYIMMGECTYKVTTWVETDDAGNYLGSGHTVTSDDCPIAIRFNGQKDNPEDPGINYSAVNVSVTCDEGCPWEEDYAEFWDDNIVSIIESTIE